VRVLLISTYELGRQPVHLSSPAASLEAAGHEVSVVDLSTDELQSDHIISVDAVAISVPMHTATRLALMIAGQINTDRPDLPIALYGLYAGVPDTEDLESVDAVFAGEYEPDLLSWVNSIARGGGSTASSSRTGRSEFLVPARGGLAGLDSYARLEFRGETRLAGAVEASHGCRHRCRHCPIPSVYDGRMRVVPKQVVLADIDQLADFGARHITFGDPDFLNAPRHSLDVLEAAHTAHPELTFDATIKVSHIIDHADLLPEMARMNLLFVVSAFESVDNGTLDVLDKGHSVEEMSRAVDLVRSAGVFIRPTWLPFLPWTEPDHIADMFEFVESHELGSSTDPVQMSIKLLIPRGSLLEEHPRVVPHLESYDPASLTWTWRFTDPHTEVLQKELETIAAEASDCGQHFTATLDQMRKTVSQLTGRAIGELTSAQVLAPRLTESWFCCAEPTQSQLVSIGIGPG
jgi:radical SAM superfamily enzyme YgiQ (UPF0313 family)